ncbi:Fpg/Nei family DNA glycosylase [Nonomuraea polychroma]|uniref:Fpg/Nei family DNA glycosylase n=1 Tax=Nonomuraea polychroma TaxID=46176 RepID=UPI000FDD3AFA|nr:DNA-formamidopyrimidine glycosylase family protein [Nonomuraea polychroma]
MPELPDVEGFRRVLSEHTGEPIRAVRVRDPGVLRGIGARQLTDALRGHRFERPWRHGKWLIAPAGGPVLMLHFGMTGSLSWHALDAPWHRHDRVVWRFDDGELRFRDMRKLQGIRLAADETQAERMLGDLGPDAREVARERFDELLSGRRGRLKSVLTDQTFLAGLGNLLADEICWHARINPQRAVADLDETERSALYGAMRRVLRESIKAGCVPSRDTWLTGARDEPDGPCPRCGTPLSRRRMTGRTTVWCPACQPS